MMLFEGVVARNVNLCLVVPVLGKRAREATVVVAGEADGCQPTHA
jgi:hypothetical protein